MVVMQFEVFETWMFQGSAQGWVYSVLKLFRRYSRLAASKPVVVQAFTKLF